MRDQAARASTRLSTRHVKNVRHEASLHRNFALQLVGEVFEVGVGQLGKLRRVVTPPDRNVARNARLTIARRFRSCPTRHHFTSTFHCRSSAKFSNVNVAHARSVPRSHSCERRNERSFRQSLGVPMSRDAARHGRAPRGVTSPALCAATHRRSFRGRSRCSATAALPASPPASARRYVCRPAPRRS